MNSFAIFVPKLICWCVLLDMDHFLMNGRKMGKRYLIRTTLERNRIHSLLAHSLTSIKEAMYALLVAVKNLLNLIQLV